MLGLHPNLLNQSLGGVGAGTRIFSVSSPAQVIQRETDPVSLLGQQCSHEEWVLPRAVSHSQLLSLFNFPAVVLIRVLSAPNSLGP